MFCYFSPRRSENSGVKKINVWQNVTRQNAKFDLWYINITTVLFLTLSNASIEYDFNFHDLEIQLINSNDMHKIWMSLSYDVHFISIRNSILFIDYFSMT